MVLGDQYDEERVAALRQRCDLDAFLRDIGHEERQPEAQPGQGMLIC